MADKQATEKQLAYWLGDTALQVNLTFAATDDYVDGVRNGRKPHNTPSEHIHKFYRPFRAIRKQKFDGLVVTGFNALKTTIVEEAFWPAVQEIFDWSKTNVLSSCFLCWGAKAALKHFHDIDSVKAPQKYFGLFEHRIVSDSTGIVRNFPDVFQIPVSRWKTPRREDIARSKALEIVAETHETGPSILVEAGSYDNGRRLYPTRLYILPHPEYDTETLRHEYERDRAKNPATPLPKNYFPGDDPNRNPVNVWRNTASIYTKWVELIYAATPHKIAHVPQPFQQVGSGVLRY